MLQRVTLLGSTGSIGDSALDVIARHPERFSVFALSAHHNVDKLAEQCLRFAPDFAVVADAARAARLTARLAADGCATQVAHGSAALVDIARDAACDTVVAAIVGAAGLPPTLAAARAGKRVLLANKEALVMSGALFMDAVAMHGATLLPLDSEHNAVYQCLPPGATKDGASTDGVGGAARRGVSRIILTASGGPFRDRDPASLAGVTPDEACAHPNWVMGRKISVDSATMMNKGLEVIEAHWLFVVPPDAIDVVIHPQSMIHSLVAYVDGSVLAQLGNPDMRIPIAHALAYPQRIASGVAPLELAAIATLGFEAPNYQRFPCLRLALAALRQGGAASAVLNAANEIAVAAFLDGRIGFNAIAAVVEAVLSRDMPPAARGLDDVLAIDTHARRLAREEVARRRRGAGRQVFGGSDASDAAATPRMAGVAGAAG